MRNLAYKSWALSLALSLYASAAVQAGERVVLYGDENYPPYSFIQDGQFKGIYVEILRRAAEQLQPDYLVELAPISWKRGLLYLEQGTGFGLFPPGIKQERGYIHEYSVPLYQETVVVFCNANVMKTHPKQFPEDFQGLTMGANRGFLLSARLMNAVYSGIVKIEEANGNESNLQKLARERIDCYVSDRAPRFIRPNACVKAPRTSACSCKRRWPCLTSKHLSAIALKPTRRTRPTSSKKWMTP